MPNPVYTYILNIYDLERIVWQSQFMNDQGLICLNAVEWFQVLLSSTNCFICTQLKDLRIIIKL